MVAKISHGESLYGALAIIMKRYFRGRRKSFPDTG